MTCSRDERLGLAAPLEETGPPAPTLGGPLGRRTDRLRQGWSMGRTGAANDASGGPDDAVARLTAWRS